MKMGGYFRGVKCNFPKKKRLDEDSGLEHTMHQINPCKPIVIIYNCKKKFRTIGRKRRKRSLYITMN
jgi:hypothetical protein